MKKSSPFHKMFSLLYLISRGIYGTWNTIKSSHAYILIQFWWTEGWMAITHLPSNFVMLYWTTNYLSWIPRMIQRGSMTLWDVFLPVPFTFTFTFTHLADAFIQSDLHCIRVTVSTFCQLLLSLGIEPMILALLTPCSTSWATGKPWHRMLWHDILNDLCFK